MEYPDGEFNLILLDAPCSATGSRPKPISEHISDKQIKSYQKLQRKLISEAVRILKPGGHMVYSTCSVLEEENEKNVEFLVEKFNCLNFIQQIKYNPFNDFDKTEVTEGIYQIKNDNFLHDTMGFFAAKFIKKLE